MSAMERGALTASELLALLGLAWWRLLVYPGGLAVLVALWLAGRGHETRDTRHETEHTPVILSSYHLIIVAPWLAVALLPLPGTRPLNRPLDVFVTLALLDAPLLITIVTALRSDDVWRSGIRRLVALLNGYPVLIGALALLSPGALTFDGLTSLPDAANLRNALAHWFGAFTLLLALFPLIGLGPFAGDDSPQRRKERKETTNTLYYLRGLCDSAVKTFVEDALYVGLWLRAVGLVLIASLPWLALAGERVWLLPVPPLVIVLLLWAFHRATAGGTARQSARGYTVLVVVQLLVLALRDLPVSR